jgi:peptide/nickel transport system substrate-binding protein
MQIQNDDNRPQGAVGRGAATKRQRGATWQRTVGAVAVAAAMLGTSVALSPAFAKGTSKPVLRVGITGLGSAIGPGLGGGNSDPLVAGGILRISKGVVNGGFTLWFASSFNVTNHNRTVTFTLRHDVRFDDGTLLTARIEKQYMQAWLADKTIQPDLQGLIKIGSVDTVGNWTVIVHLAGPSPYARYMFGDNSGFFGQPVEPRCIAHKFALLGKVDCGAGPYMPAYSQWVATSKQVYVPNPYYYDKSQQPWSKVVYLSIPSAPSMLAALQSGEIDLGQGDPTTASAAKNAGFTVISGPLYNWALFLNLKSVPAMGSLAVRQALNYAINRNILAKLVGSSPTDEIVTSDGYDPNPKITHYYTYDPGKAKALLASAGYPNGFSIKALAYGPGGQYGTPLVQAVASQLAQVGIQLNITDAPTATNWSSEYNAGAPWPALQGPFGASWTIAYYSIFMTGGFGWTDPVISSLERASLSAPPTKATEDWRAILDRTVTQAYFLPLVQGNGYYYYVGSRLKGVTWPLLFLYDFSGISPK